mgnify:CR=1 FL=1
MVAEKSYSREDLSIMARNKAEKTALLRRILSSSDITPILKEYGIEIKPAYLKGKGMITGETVGGRIIDRILRQAGFTGISGKLLTEMRRDLDRTIHSHVGTKSRPTISLEDRVDLLKKEGIIYSETGNYENLKHALGGQHYELDQPLTGKNIKNLYTSHTSGPAYRAREAAKLTEETGGGEAEKLEKRLRTQVRKLSQDTLEGRTSTLAKQNQIRWFERNTFRDISDPVERKSLSRNSANDWWERVKKYDPETEKAWTDLTRRIKTYNDEVVRDFSKRGVPAPSSELLQGHHIMMLGRGGSNSPHNILEVLGNAWEDKDSRHALLHSKDYDSFYAELQRRGHQVLGVLPDDPSIQGEKGRRLLGILEDISGSGGGAGGGQNIWNTVKPFAKTAGKTALRAVPFLGAAASVKAADDYRRQDHPLLMGAAGLSAFPGLGGLIGLGAEGLGLLWNKATEDPNFLRGPLDKRRHKPRQRGSL